MSKFLRYSFSVATLSVFSLVLGADSAFAAHGSSGGSSGGSSNGSSGGSSGGGHKVKVKKHGSSGGGHKAKKHGSSGGSSGGSTGGSSGGYGGGSSGGYGGGSSGGYGGGSSGYATASYAAPAPAASPQMAAYLNVNVPADAKVYLQGQLMTLNGTQRRYYTPAIAAGEQKSYNVTVEVVRDGKTLSKTTQALVAAGQEIEVSVTFDQKNPSDLVASVTPAAGR